jgi:hypothetical protein
VFKRTVFLACVIVLLTLTGTVFSHSPLLLVEDNLDGTLYAEAGFSDGSGASGMKCRLEDSEGRILWEGTFDEFSSVTVKIPEISPYYVIFDGGPGHIVKKEGPVLSGEDAAESQTTTSEISVDNQQALQSVSINSASSSLQPATPQTHQALNQTVAAMPSGNAVPSWYTLQMLSDRDISSLKEEIAAIRNWFPVLCLSSLFGCLALWLIAIALFRKNK